MATTKKHVIVAGNWKAEKTVLEAEQWLKTYASFSRVPDGFRVILCAPYTSLGLLSSLIHQQRVPISLAAQNISQFPSGKYTGEVSGEMLKGLVDWVIVGHSERRKWFGEDDETLRQKVVQAKSAGLGIIYCIQDEHTIIPSELDIKKDIIAYEPLAAIGTGKPDSPDNANRIIGMVKQRAHFSIVIYGGSVTQENVVDFIAQPNIDGVLPGGASLDASTFVSLVQKAASLVDKS